MYVQVTLGVSTCKTFESCSMYIIRQFWYLQVTLKECKNLVVEEDCLFVLKKRENESIQPLVAGRAFHSVAKLVLALSRTLLQCNGLDPKKSDFLKKENGRLGVYKRKIDKAVATYEAAQKKAKQELVMNVDTANRFISAALNKTAELDSKGKGGKCKIKPSRRRGKGNEDPLKFLHDLQKEAYQEE